MDGFLLINKPKDITSFGVIRQLQKKIGKVKIGHSGTLDPQTEGLLVLALGKGCKLLKEITKDSKKTYIAKMKFGLLTTTGDIYGDVVKEEHVTITEEQIKETIESFQKTYLQIPPKYSAKKINGKRAYELARDGKDIDMTKSAKEITIYDINIEDINMDTLEVIFKASVSKGTYIRSLIEDIANEMETIATMTELKRIETDGFSINEAIDLEDFNEDKIISIMDYLLSKNNSIFEAEGKLLNLLKNGVRIENQEIIKKFEEQQSIGKILVVQKDTKELIGIYTEEENKYIPYIML